MNTRTSNSL